MTRLRNLLLGVTFGAVLAFTVTMLVLAVLLDVMTDATFADWSGSFGHPGLVRGVGVVALLAGGVWGATFTRRGTYTPPRRLRDDGI